MIGMPQRLRLQEGLCTDNFQSSCKSSQRLAAVLITAAGGCCDEDQLHVGNGVDPQHAVVLHVRCPSVCVCVC